MTDTETALLAAIRRDPGDDTVRLAFADWLDENPKPDKECPRCKGGNVVWNISEKKGGPHGDNHPHKKGGPPVTRQMITCPTCTGIGSVPDTGNADRAELIRVQVELHNKPCSSFMYSCHENGSSRCECNDFGKFDALLARESALILAHPEWRPKCPVHRGTPCTFGPEITCPMCGRSGYVGEFRRGFLECVQVPTLATVLEERITCEACGDSRSPHGRHYCYVLSCESPRLKREWHPTAWVRDELAPFLPHVTHVYLGDSEQYLGGPGEGGYWWRDDVVHDHDPRLPKFLCPKGAYYTTAAANTALARCVADVLRAILCGARG